MARWRAEDQAIARHGQEQPYPLNWDEQASLFKELPGR